MAAKKKSQRRPGAWAESQGGGLCAGCRRLGFVVLLLSLGGALGSCAGLEQALAPDPQLSDPSADALGATSGSTVQGSVAVEPGAKPKNSSQSASKDKEKGNRSSSQNEAAELAQADGQGAVENDDEVFGRDVPLVAQDFPDVLDAPEDLQEQVLAVVGLGVITIFESDVPEAGLGAAASVSEDSADNPADNSGNGFMNDQGEVLLVPNQPVTRRQYARWLLAANNVFYGDRPSFKLRLAPDSSEPIFKDVSASDPDFAVIQGLAEAGIIPSGLSGAQQQISFKPDVPLRREDLLLWKLPLDVRGSLPASNLELVKEAWGFQDASKINTAAQRAVLADYQNGDQAVIRRVFGYTTLLQPSKPVTRAEAAAALAYFGSRDDVIYAAELDVIPTIVDPEKMGG